MNREIMTLFKESHAILFTQNFSKLVTKEAKSEETNLQGPPWLMKEIEEEVERVIDTNLDMIHIECIFDCFYS